MNSNPVLLNFDGGQNPLLSSVAALDDVTATTDLPSGDLFDLMTVEAGDGRMDFSLETPEPEEIVVDFHEAEKSDKTAADEVMSIHSYSQPQIKDTPEHTTVEKPLKKVQVGRVAKRQRKPVRHFDETSEDSEVEDVRPPLRKRHKSNSSSKSFTTSSKKVKLYEMDAFEDPEMEKCRQNAINAKMNRDKKKNEKTTLQKEMGKLRRENEELKKKNSRYRTKLTSVEARVQAMEAFIQSNGLGSLLKASGNDDNALSTSGDTDDEVIYY